MFGKLFGLDDFANELRKSKDAFSDAFTSSSGGHGGFSGSGRGGYQPRGGNSVTERASRAARDTASRAAHGAMDLAGAGMRKMWDGVTKRKNHDEDEYADRGRQKIRAKSYDRERTPARNNMGRGVERDPAPSSMGRGPARNYDRGYERENDRGFDRGFDRGYGNERSRGYDRGYDNDRGGDYAPSHRVTSRNSDRNRNVVSFPSRSYGNDDYYYDED